MSGKGCVLWLWHSLGFSLTFFFLHMCVCCDSLLLIKMTCDVNWIIVRERCAESTSFSRPDLGGSRGKSVKASGDKPGCSGWPWLLLCLAMLSMLQNMLLHRRLGRWIKVMISSAPAAEADFTSLRKHAYSNMYWTLYNQTRKIFR